MRWHPRNTTQHFTYKLALSLAFVAALLALLPGASWAAGGKDGKPVQSASVAAGPLPWPRYGVDVAGNSGADVMTAMRAAGAKFVRIQINWSAIEPSNTTPANFSWTATDSRLNIISAAGLQAEISINGCPTWACDSGQGPINKVSLDEFAQFTGAVAARYSAAPFNVHFWEFWNEPDTTTGDGGSSAWGNHGALYAQMLAAGVPPIRAADPQATIASGGLAYDNFISDGGPFNRDFLRDVLQAGGGQYLDYIAYHYYAANVHWPTLQDKNAELSALVTRYGFTKPLVLNETGLTSSTDPRWGTPQWGPNSVETQARFVTQSFVNALSVGLPGLFWFSARDFTTGSDLDPFAEAGLIRLDNSHKPAFNAYQTVANEIGESAFVRQLPSSEVGNSKVLIYEFAGTGHPVYVMWTNETTSQIITLPKSLVTKLLDMTGEELVTLKDNNGDPVIAVTQDPLFVELPRFNDVPADFFAYDHIEYLAAHGIVSGYSDNSFRPGNTTTRGQLTKIITLGMGWPINTTGGPHFLDVATDNPFYSFIETAYNKGVISGYEVQGGRIFRWGDNVTRGQLSKIVVSAKGWTLANPVTPTFSDVATSNPFYQQIETAVAHGIISGYDIPNTGSREFRWGNDATRAQIAKIAHLAIIQ